MTASPRVIVGGNDWAGAWAVDADGRPLYRRGARRRAAARDGLSLRRQPRDVRADRQLQDRPGARAGDSGAAWPMSSTGFTLAASPLLPWAAIAPLRRRGALASRLSAPGGARAARRWRLVALRDAAADPRRSVAGRGAARAAARRRGGRGRRFAEHADRRPRRTMPTAALAELTQRLKQFHDLDVRVVHAGAPDPAAALADTGTELLQRARTRALADVPRQRVAGAVMITDGEVHDMPPTDRLASARRSTCCSPASRARPTAGSSSRTRRASASSARRCS